MSRYIDADELIQLGLQDGSYEYVSVQEIADFPTADVVEVVHGEWIYKNDNPLIGTGYWECSICGIGKLLHEENFCPNCGARMDGEK